jgi:tellurite resistance protein TerC
MPLNWVYWLAFLLFVLAMMALDLGVFTRHDRPTSFRVALCWTALWFALAAGFAVLLYFHGHAMTGHMVRPNRVLSLEFVTGYLVEEALSVDNLFIFLLIFRHFGVPAGVQRRVLTWGILGALVMRGLFIFTGVALVNRFQWIVYLFGVFLVYVGAKLFFQKKDERIKPDENPVARLFRRYFRVTPSFVGHKFFLRQDGLLFATPLALVLLIVETTDVVFATDSIPAILAITRDPFIVFTSNVFAILGLRSLYFALAGLMDLFHLLRYGLAVILSFIGVKMMLSHYYELPIGWALGVVVAVLALSIALSVAFPEKKEAEIKA